MKLILLALAALLDRHAVEATQNCPLGVSQIIKDTEEPTCKVGETDYYTKNLPSGQTCTVTLPCDAGNTAVGPTAFTCTNGTLAPTDGVAECVEKKDACTKVEDTATATVTPENNIKANEMFTALCKDTKKQELDERLTDGTMTCNAGATEAGTLEPTADKANCYDKCDASTLSNMTTCTTTTPPAAKTVSDGTTVAPAKNVYLGVKDTCVLACNGAYKVKDGPNVKCEVKDAAKQERTLGGATCEAKADSCPITVAHGILAPDYDHVAKDNKVTVKCADKYELFQDNKKVTSGSVELTCGDEKTFNGKLPVCKKEAHSAALSKNSVVSASLITMGVIVSAVMM